MSDQPQRAPISASPDEVAARRRTGGSRKPRGSDDDGSSVGGAGGPGWIAFSVLLLGLIAVGALLYLQQGALGATAADLAAAGDRIRALEERLNMTDETLSASGEDTSEKIDFWESEIRKLWDVVNKRNMDLIKANTAAVARVDKVLGEAAGDLGELKASVGRLETDAARRGEIVDQITSLDLQMNQVQRALRDVVERSNNAQQAIAGLNSGLGKRVKDTEQAIQAIDAYRLQTNGRLADIERRLGTPPLQ